jgi:hypothetical protein
VVLSLPILRFLCQLIQVEHSPVRVLHSSRCAAYNKFDSNISNGNNLPGWEQHIDTTRATNSSIYSIAETFPQVVQWG